MRSLLQRDKKATSLIVSYVLLISIGLAIAGLVYAWLRFYAVIDEVEKCPDGISLVIMDSSYNQGPLGGSELELNLSLQNRGRFNIEGYTIRVHNRTGAEIGIYTIYHTEDPLTKQPEVSFPLKPGNITRHNFGFRDLTNHVQNRICVVEVQPFIKNDAGNFIHCSQISLRKLDCR